MVWWVLALSHFLWWGDWLLRKLVENFVHIANELSLASCSVRKPRKPPRLAKPCKLRFGILLGPALHCKRVFLHLTSLSVGNSSHPSISTQVDQKFDQSSLIARQVRLFRLQPLARRFGQSNLRPAGFSAGQRFKAIQRTLCYSVLLKTPQASKVLQIAGVENFENFSLQIHRRIEPPPGTHLQKCCVNGKKVHCTTGRQQ